ncbi:MAG: cytochrome P450 [Proteobacteria bacterium]|nr:cytochrome P450 [Pseudomonadota bacterium]
MDDFYDPYMPEIKEDPYPVYARMRAERPVYYLERWNAWALARFQDIWTASEDLEHYSVRHGTSDVGFLRGETAPMQTLNSYDPPAHTDLRKRMFKYFAPRAARGLEGEIRKWTVECLERHRDEGRIDAVRELGQQVAVRVACTVSGFPMEDSDFLVDIVSRFFSRDPETDGMSEEGRAAQSEMWDYLESLARRRAGSETRSDAIDVLLNYRDELGEMSSVRMAQHLTLLLVGATETFPKTFATGLLRLWQHPDQRAELIADPGLIPTALTEILRYDMPTQWLGRTVIKEHEIDGHKLHPDQPVLFLYPSGNHDELEFENADTFDIHRNAPRILTFGHGVHRCLGSFFARKEGEVLFEEVLKRFPNYEVLLDETVKPDTEFVQGYSHFPIALNP